MYYNSDLKDYFDLYSEAKKAIKSWSGDFTRGENGIPITDVATLFSSEYEQEAKDYFISQIQWFLPEEVNLALHQAEDKYNKSLV